jgi:hypothetical protein
MAAAAMRASPNMANGGSSPHSTNGSRRAGSRKYNSAAPAPDTGYDDDLDYGQSDTKSSYQRSLRNAMPGHKGRSFSARAGDQSANLNYTTRKPAPGMPPDNAEESTTPRGLPPAEYTSEPTATMQSGENTPRSASISLGQPSPLSRSNTTQSTAEKRHDWASDRSPLQKLEVTLTGISKEEKRARVQEAEMRLRERLARQKAERVEADSTAVIPLPKQMPEANPASRRPRTSGRRDINMEDVPRAATVSRQPEGMAMRHHRNASTNQQYPAIQRPGGHPYAQAEVAVPVSVRMSSVPRRSVTMSGPKPGPPGSSMAPTRSVSQSGPSNPVRAAPVAAGPPAGSMAPTRSVSQSGPSKPVRAAAVAAVAADAVRVETPPALRTALAAQESVESHRKPKREKQSVSFDMPPPTPPPVFEWRNAPVARLGASDFDFQHLDISRSKAWWEGGGSKDRRKSRALPKNYQTPAQKLTGKQYLAIESNERTWLKCIRRD